MVYYSDWIADYKEHHWSGGIRDVWFYRKYWPMGTGIGSGDGANYFWTR